MILAGCGKRVFKAGAGMPFELDSVFGGKTKEVERNWKEKGMQLAKEREFDRAVEAFQRYVEEQPEDFFGFNAIAVCYKNLGDHAKAMQNYERALELAETAEERAKILANVGNLYFSADKPQGALGYYKEAAAEFKENPLYLVLIARTFIALNEPERALKVLTQAEAEQKKLEKYEPEDDRGLGFYLMAYSYLALGEEDKVFRYLEQSLKTNPSKYAAKLEADFDDQKSLFYTLKDDPRLKKALRRAGAGS